MVPCLSENNERDARIKIGTQVLFIVVVVVVDAKAKSFL